MDKRVAVTRCNAYSTEHIKQLLKSHLAMLNIDPNTEFGGKKVVIKPNLVMKAPPERSATTHPAVIEAAASILIEAGADVTIAESPGGMFSEKILEGIYKTCGITEIAERLPVKLNYDTGYEVLHTDYTKSSKQYNILRAIYEADVIVNISKLKTHTFMMMSAAVKNLFGTIPGVQKFEMHARFPNEHDFAEYINDLTYSLCREKQTYHIVDAVTGMQGNGPTGGTPFDIGAILSGCDPFTLDTACMSLMSLDGNVIMQSIAHENGLCPKDASELTILGDSLESLKVKDYIKPDTLRGKKFEHIPSFLQPHPEVDRSICVGCGECAANCPVKTIEIKKDKGSSGKKKAHIIKKNCIRCYCCQELCHFNAVAIKKNFIYKLIK